MTRKGFYLLRNKKTAAKNGRIIGKLEVGKFKIQDRWYQDNCVDALFLSLKEEGCHPVAAIPTGGGKTVILCKLIDKLLSDNPTKNILVLSHVKEILSQDYFSIRDYFEWDEEAMDYSEPSQIGIYSAGMNSETLNAKTIKKITVAGIQSAYRSPELFKHFDVVVIDEAHRINTNQRGMYRQFLATLKANYAGLTATPYRTDHGYIHEGENSLFNLLAYDLTSLNNFNRLIKEGYLSKLISKKTKLFLDPKGARTTTGDFNNKDLGEKLNREGITNTAIEEIIKFGEGYKKWLIFSIDINHSESIANRMNHKGIKTVVINSKTENREQIINDIKNGVYRCIVSVDILTTGFDDPDIDLIALMRPTKSPILHVQTVGRGLRPSPKKDHCLILDFAGNTMRLGPVNDMRVKMRDKNKRKVDGEAMAKECPDCNAICHLSAKICPECNYEFPRKEKIKKIADSHSEILKGSVIDLGEDPDAEKKEIKKLKINRIKYYRTRNHKTGKYRFMADYICDNRVITNYCCLDDDGPARFFAEKFVRTHWKKKYGQQPKSIKELELSSRLLKIPKKIKVELGGKFDKILEWSF